MSAFKTTLATIAGTGVLLGGAAVTPLVPYETPYTGEATIIETYDTPSGMLELGQWAYLQDASSTVARFLDATSTPVTMYNVPTEMLKGMEQVHIIRKAYFTYTAKDGSKQSVEKPEKEYLDYATKGVPAPVHTELITVLEAL